jgi:hemolysin activation/secretion protein
MLYCPRWIVKDIKLIVLYLRWMKTAPPIVLGAVLLLILNPAAPVWAQSQANFQGVPAQQNPGLLTTPTPGLRDLRDKTQMQQPPPDEIKLELPDKKTAAPAVAPVIIPLTQVRLEGVTVFKAEEIQALVSPYVGKDQTLEQLNALVTALTDMYHQRGYLTADAFIPPQDIVNGELTIRVQEGYIGKIAIEGGRFYKARVVKNALSQKPGQLLNFKVLERELNRINRLNEGYKVKAFLAAGDHPGQTDLKILMAEKQPFQISGVADNQGRPFIGLYRGGVDFRNDSVTGVGDRFFGSWRATPNLQLAMASYTRPLNRFGTELSTNAAFSHVNVLLPVKNPPDIVGKSFTTSITLAQPLDRERHLVLDASVLWSRVSSFFDGDQTGLTDVRALQSGLTFTRYDRWGYTFNRVQNTVALGGIGGTSQFWKAENYFNRLFFLPKNNLLILRGNAQITPHFLPASQQFQIGGDNSVRGFTEGLLIGDRGVNFGIEHRFPVPGLRRLSPWLASRLQLAWFYDYGRVWVDRSSPSFVKNVSTLPQRTLLQGAGVGLRAQLTRFMQGFIDIGFGIGDRKDVEPLHHQPTARVHFGIRSDLLPNAYRMRTTTPVVYVPQVPHRK